MLALPSRRQVRDELHENMVKRGQPLQSVRATANDSTAASERWARVHPSSAREQRFSPPQSERCQSSIALRSAHTAQRQSPEPERRLKRVVQVINLQHKLGLFRRPHHSPESLHPKARHSGTPDTSSKKDRWTLLFEEADREVHSKLAAILQSQQQEEKRRVRFARHAEVFSKSPVRSHSHLKQYKDILGIEEEEKPQSQGRHTANRKRKVAISGFSPLRKSPHRS